MFAFCVDIADMQGCFSCSWWVEFPKSISKSIQSHSLRSHRKISTLHQPYLKRSPGYLWQNHWQCIHDYPLGVSLSYQQVAAKNEGKNDTEDKQIVIWLPMMSSVTLSNMVIFIYRRRENEWLQTCLCRVGAKNICQNWKSVEQRIQRGKNVCIFLQSMIFSYKRCEYWYLSGVEFHFNSFQISFNEFASLTYGRKGISSSACLLWHGVWHEKS